ncbi:PBP1A family penicillin-binding protein [Cohnella pontilimi]|uniref:PBP1A family penicillin-binding protein n=1 Tax=Cohnella pontilimi TaxID=2564100 RepID=A0A4U0F352_9BACL|nr:PBP1A family penicillin-binding protein [Cohnella pontilimi]TJY38975.1 PBP1A family penicillin-binding protein [Cohnella pontilimi]
MDKHTDNRPQKKGFLAPAASMRKKLAWFILFCLLLSTGGALVLQWFGTLPAAAVPQSTQIMDAAGVPISVMQGGVNRQPVALRDISPWLSKATLAVEDRRFYDHRGVDARGLIRAAWVDLRHLSKKEGASTLTQQLARNLYLTHERTWTRKMKEAWYAARLENTYSKNEILQMYLNQIYYGHGAYGAEAAARLYFGKPAKELSLAESALLAGIPKGPRYYSPHLHAAQSEARRNKVLQAMRETGVITAEQAAKAMRDKPAVIPLPDEPDRVAPYFSDYVRKVAVERLGIDERLLADGGLIITTTLDSKMQKAAETAVKNGLPGESNLQAALVAVDPRNGYIKAMVGGRSYKHNQFNRVFATTRQPGSSFKPFVYAAALDQRVLTPATRFRSEPTIFYYDNYREIYRPSNFNDRYFHSEIGLRQAIASSDNIYAVNAVMQVGPEEVVKMARKLGITSQLKAVPSLALGTYPVSPFEMASAFSVFASGGRKYEPLAILRIEDRAGRILYEAHPRGEQVISPALAYVTTRLLESVFDRGGTAHRVAQLLKRPAAGKSGTTNTDAWFVGYTPELSTAVWVGYDRGRAVTSGEAHRAAPIFANFTETALQDRYPAAFPIPPDVVSVHIDPENGLLAGPGCPNPVLESFLAGTEPTESCSLHKTPENAAPTEPGHGIGSWLKRLRHWWGG